MHENQNCPKKSLRDNTISSIVFQLDEKALCITALSHFCQLNWWSACKASITPATSKAFLPQANLMNLQTKILRSPGPFGPQQLGKNPFYYSFGSWNPYFTISPECLRLLHVRKRGLGGRSGGGAGLGALWDFRACSNWISTGHVHHTSASHILSFTCEYICSFLRQRIGLRAIAYVYVIWQLLYFIWRVGQSVPKCLDERQGAWGDRKCGLIAVILTHNDCHSCPDRSLPGLVATKRTR